MPIPPDDVALLASLTRKVEESVAVKRALLDTQGPAVVACCRAVAGAFAAGGRLFAFGNGGSACDAEHVAVEMVHPVVEKRRPLPAVSLVAGPALITAIANDEDYSVVFARQLRREARPGDIALGISTSGQSESVAAGLRTARELGLVTVAFTGHDGGKVKRIAEHCLVVPSFSVHRVQEGHTLLLHVLWDLVHVLLGEEDVL